MDPVLSTVDYGWQVTNNVARHINYYHLSIDWELIKKRSKDDEKGIGLKGSHQHTYITTYWFGVMLRLDMEP